MGLGGLAKVIDGCAFPCLPGDWCSILLATAVQLDRTGLEAHPRQTGADLWAFWMQLASERGEKIELFTERG